MKVNKYRTNICGELTISDLGKNVVLSGFVQTIRDHGGVMFLDLRDHAGITQVVVHDESMLEGVSKETVIKVTGEVIRRDEETVNTKLLTGEIEIKCESLEVLSPKAHTLPFEIDGMQEVNEEVRLKYRYLDMRSKKISNNIKLRSDVLHYLRNKMYDLGFTEVQTPILTVSSPEGARDYLVPSRVNKGSFYALPQSPQIYKQLLMIGGVEKYFQIARCFRDEDLRADRQPEFTQIDMEMSFVNEEDVMDNTEKLFQTIFKEVKGYDIKLPLMRMKYDDAINFYGSDKPDLRFDMKINDVTDVFSKCDFELFKRELENKGIINAIVVKNAADKYSRKDIDKLTDFVKTYKSNGLFFLKYNNNEFAGSIVKILTDEVKEELIKNLCLEENDLIFVIAGKKLITKTSLGALRCKLARDLDLIKKGDYKFLWVTDFPSFEWSEEENRFVACHHPFTAPKDEDIDKLLTDKEHCYSKAYDIVCNGYEAGGGSIRIHNADVQEKMFEALELTKEDIEEKFGFFVNAFKYGTPPHGGLAIGLERLTMLLCETDNIKDVIAFPKTSSASCLMSEAPNTVSEKQLEELNIMVK